MTGVGFHARGGGSAEVGFDRSTEVGPSGSSSLTMSKGGPSAEAGFDRPTAVDRSPFDSMLLREPDPAAHATAPPQGPESWHVFDSGHPSGTQPVHDFDRPSFRVRFDRGRPKVGEA